MDRTDLECDPPLPEHHPIRLQQADRRIVDVRCLSRHSIQFEHLKPASLEIRNRWRAEVETSEVEAGMCLRGGVHGVAKSLGFQAAAIQKDGAAAVRSQFS